MYTVKAAPVYKTALQALSKQKDKVIVDRSGSAIVNGSQAGKARPYQVSHEEANLSCFTT